MRKRFLVTMVATMALGLCIAGQASAAGNGPKICKTGDPNFLSGHATVCGQLVYAYSDAGGPVYRFHALVTQAYPDSGVAITGMAAAWYEWSSGSKYVSEGNCTNYGERDTEVVQAECTTTALHHCPPQTPYQGHIRGLGYSTLTSTRVYYDETWVFYATCP